MPRIELPVRMPIVNAFFVAMAEECGVEMQKHHGVFLDKDVLCLPGPFEDDFPVFQVSLSVETWKVLGEDAEDRGGSSRKVENPLAALVLTFTSTETQPQRRGSLEVTTVTGNEEVAVKEVEMMMTALIDMTREGGDGTLGTFNEVRDRPWFAWVEEVAKNVRSGGDAWLDKVCVGREGEGAMTRRLEAMFAKMLRDDESFKKFVMLEELRRILRIWRRWSREGEKVVSGS